MLSVELLFQIIGIFAGIFIAISYMPNAIKTIKMKTTQGFSFLQYILCHLGCALFVAYGISILILFGSNSWGAYGVIIPNALILIMNSIVIYHMIRERNFSMKMI